MAWQLPVFVADCKKEEMVGKPGLLVVGLWATTPDSAAIANLNFKAIAFAGIAQLAESLQIAD